ncbi:autotransporter beta-domain protein [Leptotrichia sp. oral taxon 215 str. W9775]|uniref:autotransporter-associated N-terminal domain-containing protein n=1 Tax=Leptotrichia sp. oral taxon 215 TaxID=712359 RepID=UPI0003ADFDD0|nr:autotransporter-associated N-terminal domain-containing protein [Leptotrichia sp. oral taxon 215]ERK65715.1 autotransporter beta-domain protein [Leptotrichia sp. oral taxon 215 str. W9775]
MTNNLKKLEQDLRALAKRCKNISYTKGLLLSFLILGLLSFSEGLTSPEIKSTESSINQARKELNTSISDMKTLFREAKRENDKLLKGSNLELIQLMEQGDQVVKSPWSSWQYGMNYFYSNWRGTYKGKGDKKEKYPYEGIYRRSNDLFLRSISPNSRNYSRYVTRVYDDPLHSATTSTIGLSNASWGIESSVFDQEPVTTLNLLATVRPKEIKKQAPVVNLGTIEGPEEISFSINPPEVEISTPTIREVSFNPVTPVTTTLPGFLSFNMKMNSFCDGINSTNCDTAYIEGKRVTDSEIASVEDILDKKTNAASGYVWGNDSNKPAVMKNSAGKPFKIYFDVTEGKNVTVTKNLVIDSSAYRNDTDTNLILGNTSLNNKSGNQTAYFLLGGSRIGSLDAKNGSITNNAKVSLAGPYVTAFEIQTNNGAGTREIKNTGEINDEIEKIGYRGPNGLGGIKVPVKINNRYYYEGTNVEITANDMNYNGTSVNGVDQENTPGSFGNGIGGFARGADTGYFDANGIARSNYDNGGYMGYKIGLLLTHEDVDNGSTGINKLTNTGKINFSGSNSIGMQVDAEGSTPNVQVLNSGNGSISISGRSYGMKWDSRVHGNSTLENAGSITTGGGYSAGIAVIEQQGKTGTDSIRAYQGKVKNTGGITVNGSNSIGMYLKVNAQDNITNTGTINVNGTANIGMRVDKGSVTTDATGDPSAINKSNIVVKGTANIGMVSNGASKAQNTGGTITLTGTTGNSAGMYATGGGTVENTGTITGSGLTDTTGISVDTGSTGTSSGNISLSGSRIAGVYNAGTFTITGGNVTTNGTGASIYAKGTVNTDIKAGTITSSGGSVGLFADDTSTINLGTTTTAPTLVTNSGGLMFYNNPTSSAGAQTNKFNLLHDVSGTVNSGGLAFYLKDVNTATQLKTALDNMILNKDLILSLKNGSYLFTVKNSSIGAGTEMKLSELPGVTTSGLTSVGTRVKIDNATSGNDYKILKITGGNILVDEDVNLETVTDKYRRIDKESSSIKVASSKKIEGTSANQVAIGQRNTITANAADMKLINEGTIKLDGNKSTGIAGETGTIENKGIINVNGVESTGLYGADGSVITNDTAGKINIGSKGAGILAQNDLDGTLKTTGKITVENKGDITANSNGVKTIGIYADNANKSVGSTVKHTSGNIDLLNAKGSLGIYTNSLGLTSSGNIKVGDESAGVNAVNSTTVVSGGNVEVGTKSIGFILEGIGKTSTTTFDGQAAGTLKINGPNSVGYYLVNADANTTTNFKDNLAFNPGNNKYTYIYIKGNSATDKSKLVYNQAGKTIDTDGSVFIFGKDSDIKLDTAFTLTSAKDKVVAAYLKNSGTLTNEGSIDLSGDKAVALYGEAGGALVNNNIIKVGTNGVGIYNKGATTGENGANGVITLNGDYGIGMRSENATGNIENKGKIESSKLRAVGMSSSNGSNAVTNSRTIELSGQESIGLHTDNKGTAGHAVTNTGTITLVDANDEDKPNIGIYSEHSSDVIVNNGKIEAGKNTLGIYGKAGGNITLGASSETKVGDNGVAVFSTGGDITIANGAKLETGANNGVGVYYSGSNGTITNNTDKITIGDKSFGFVIKGGTNNKFFSNSTGTVDLPDNSVYLYSADTTGTTSTVKNYTNLRTTGGELAYGIYTNGGGENYGNMDMTQGKGHVGIYSYLPHPTGAVPATVTPNVFVNHGRIDVSASDLTVATDQKNGIGMAAGYVKQRTQVENVLDASGNVVIDPLTGAPKTETKIYRDVIGLGNIENRGVISVTTPNSIGMYAGGKGSIAKNYGRIELSGTDLNVGMFLEDGAEGYNYGTITTVGTGNVEQVGVAVLREAKFHNYGTVNIDAEDGIGIAIGGKLTLVNRGEFTISGNKKTATMHNGTGNVTASGEGAVAIATISDDSKIMGVLPVNQVGIVPKEGTYDAVVTYNGVEVPNVQTVDVIPELARGKTTIPTAPIGIYLDTTGVNATRPVNNLGLLSATGIKYADLIIGTEAAEQTNEKYLKLSKDLIAPYNDMILEAQRQGLRRWQIYSSSLTWMAKAVQNKNTQVIENLYLVKVPYTVWVGQQSTPINSTDTFNFAEGLDQRYGVEALGTRERKLFEKLNSIGNNEHILLSQAFDEMMGHQYGNTQQRMQATGSILDKEFTHLKNEWDNKSKQSNKIKTFGSRGEYKTDTAGIIDYTNDAYGVAYVHEDETIKLGNSSGWYAGAVHNRFKLKDIGKSKENTTMLKLGVFKTMSPSSDHNGSLQWTISGEGYASISDMHRRYLVVDDIFSAKSTYYTYGVALKNELSKEFRTSERTSIKPYGSLKLEYGRFNGIKEKTGEIRLEIQSNDYHSIKPELGIEFKYKQPMAVKTTFVTTLGLAYENELGKVGDVNNKGRVRFTTADWFGIRGEKDDRKGNFKADLNLGIENQRVGFTLNAGYDTKGKNVRGGIGFRAIY